MKEVLINTKLNNNNKNSTELALHLKKRRRRKKRDLNQSIILIDNGH